MLHIDPVTMVGKTDQQKALWLLILHLGAIETHLMAIDTSPRTI